MPGLPPVVLGVWKQWSVAANGHLAMEFASGSSCVSGARRSALVYVSCRTDDHMPGSRAPEKTATDAIRDLTVYAAASRLSVRWPSAAGSTCYVSVLILYFPLITTLPASLPVGCHPSRSPPRAPTR